MADLAKSLSGNLTREERADGWANAITGLGTVQRDKRLSTVLEPEELSAEEIDDLLEGSDMAARIVESPAEDMLRRGFDVVVEGDPEAAERTMAFIDDIGLLDKLQDAVADADGYGGSAILLGAVDHARNLAQPLDLERLEEVGWLTTLKAHELGAVDWYRDVTAARYGEPAVYEIDSEQYDGKVIRNLRRADLPLVHESRLLKFQGVRLPRKRMRERDGWGGSVLTRCHHVLRDFEMSWSAAAHLLSDFSQAIMKFKGLTEMLEAGSEDLIVKRAALIDMSRSVARCVLLDAEDEEFERKATPMSGMPEMLQQLALRLAAAGRMPVSKMMGQAPAGLNATGASDIRFWYDYLAGRQTKQVVPPLKAFLKAVFNARGGPTRGVEPDKWSVKFRPLWQLTELEEADLKLKTAQADQIWVGIGALTGPEVAVSHFSGPVFNPNLVIDVEARAALGAPDVATPDVNAEADTPGATTAPAGGGDFVAANAGPVGGNTAATTPGVAP